MRVSLHFWRHIVLRAVENYEKQLLERAKDKDKISVSFDRTMSSEKLKEKMNTARSKAKEYHGL